ncbi:hypothetical protein IEN85_09395 [Pelagicoccus sp. NFK12]|uniref:Prepilin-type N-terminal cleavage/methylation domain-containing protein n=1 Tax=Pelagicoccus enzymogenes TaxID=2773457 RepID=A0A927F772_9BACT|nr:hypothetical protein [Pelagicoccus enzymogenes]MBD5779708.1 hypothetical protein [Pelagicoccus enzymogenes]
MLEVVVALAMLALIAVPAIGLATMAVGSSKEQMATGAASELKARVDTALRALAGEGVFASGFIPTDGDLSFVGSRDLRFIEIESGALDVDNDRHYRIFVREPEGYSYNSTDPYRIVVYEVIWPYKSDELGERNQLFFATVFRK